MDQNKKEKLILRLIEYLPMVARNRELIDGIRKYYVSKNIDSSVPLRIINNQELNLLSDMNLCLFVNAINSVTNVNLFRIDVKKYFDEKDIMLAEKYKKDKYKKDNTVVFHDVSYSKLIPDIFICNEFNFKDIFELSQAQRFNYNFNTQREGRKIVKGNHSLTIPKENRKAILEIQEEWGKGTFVPNMITYNIINPVSIKYDVENRNLEIELTEDGQIDVVDGWHRQVACIGIMNQNPDFDLGFYYVRIMNNFGEARARKFITQEDKHTPINSEHVKLMDVDDLSSQIARFVQENGSEKLNYLYHKFAIDARELEINKYCLYSIISYPLKTFWKADNFETEKIREIQNLLYDKLNYIISLNSSKFKNFKKSRENSVITMNGTFALYMMIIYKLYELRYDTEFNETIKKIINRIDFSFNNPIWRKFGIIDENNNMTRKKINLKEHKDMEVYIEKIIAEINEEMEGNNNGEEQDRIKSINL